ncbi:MULTISPECIES: LysE family translocator [unclassified Mesorhizobium]|uniref:LysE family translocator n=1 Tax=unclassified Mesorhizobium TaxID=325217 RepID=UPI0003CFD107|nr:MULTISPECIES: LysE family translocator [unclassified Mesorhizobium]ESZ19579.1 amino acid transporter [Mesorhizobium sp. L2C084A000]RUW88647.1 LysE family translocator [Mesorhizobium sp. M7A.F.Ca.US.010.02.1.1]
MPSLDLWIPFALATLAFACMPGPAILYMTAQTLAHGRQAGLMAALGVHLGCYVHILAAAVGLAALMEHAPVAFSMIRLAGATYLISLGLAMFLGWNRMGEDGARPAPNTFRDSMVVEILNPKTALFFLTFLPQFVDPSAALAVGLQFLILGIVVNLIFSMADLAAVGIASLAVGRFTGGGAGRVIPKTCGSILIGLGVALVSHHI